MFRWLTSAMEYETNEHANMELANETMDAFWSNELLKLKSCLEPACSWFQNLYLLDSDLSLFPLSLRHHCLVTQFRGICGAHVTEIVSRRRVVIYLALDSIA